MSSNDRVRPPRDGNAIAATTQAPWYTSLAFLLKSIPPSDKYRRAAEFYLFLLFALVIMIAATAAAHTAATAPTEIAMITPVGSPSDAEGKSA